MLKTEAKKVSANLLFTQTEIYPIFGIENTANGMGGESMASHKEVVRIPGQLLGMGHTVQCMVTAIRVSLSGTNAFEYTNPVISGTPYDLPDGFYELTYGWKTQKVQRLNGAFLAAIAG